MKGYYVSVPKRRLFTLLHKHKDWSIGQFGNRLNCTPRCTAA